MKLSEIKALQEMHSTSEVTIEKWEGHEPDGEYVKPFDVLIKYRADGDSYTDHPYGDTTAREHHGVSVEVISVTAAEVVEVIDEETDKVLKMFSKGTDVKNIPGYTADMENIFKEAAEDDANGG